MLCVYDFQFSELTIRKNTISKSLMVSRFVKSLQIEHIF